MAILGINGYATSGKNTVATIIQYLMCKNLGDTTVEEIVGNYRHETWLGTYSGWVQRSWAWKVKEMASMLTGEPLENFKSQEFKNSYLGPEWDYYVIDEYYKGIICPVNKQHKYLTYEEAKEKADRGNKAYSNHNVEYVVSRKSMTVRQLLQELGTDACRNQLHPNVWVNALMADYVPTKVQWADGPLGGYEDGPLPNWIITDTRFPNEADAIKAKGGIVIKVVRTGVLPANNHASETSLDDYNFDYVIHNDGNINDLEQKVREFVASDCFTSL